MQKQNPLKLKTPFQHQTNRNDETVANAWKNSLKECSDHSHLSLLLFSTVRGKDLSKIEPVSLGSAEEEQLLTFSAGVRVCEL